jgi:hypothetical protein
LTIEKKNDHNEEDNHNIGLNEDKIKINSQGEYEYVSSGEDD